MDSIVKSFGANKVLTGVTLRVRRGTVHALMGENGAGKSTLMKILGGMHQMDEGQIFIDGKPVTIDSPHTAQNLGISMIHQELSSLPDLSVAANVYLGREPLRGPLNLIDKKRMVKETREVLQEIGSPISPEIDVRSLSVSQAQMVEIAKAISYDSDIIVMDEPTSAITETETNRLFQVIRKLKSQGKAIIYISHKMNEIFQIADDITVLRDGQFIGTYPAEELDHDRLISLMVGREIGEQFATKNNRIGDVLLEVRNLTKGKKYRDVSFSVRKGEILGIAGLMGAGRTEIAEAIFGFTPADSGEILLDGKPVSITKPSDAISRGIALVPEDRKLVGLNLVGTVRSNITVANLVKYCLAGQVVRQKEERAISRRYIKTLSIKTPSPDHVVGNLSGGNQQKVVLARWLSCDPRVLILDEPTRGIDVGAKAEIHRLMCEYASQGNAVIMISSELPEIMNMSDRTIVMHEGCITGEFHRDEITQEAVMACASGIKRERSTVQ